MIPKDAATMMKLEEAIKNNILFQHLEKDELIDVMDAMVDVKKKAGETVMSQVRIKLACKQASKHATKKRKKYQKLRILKLKREMKG